MKISEEKIVNPFESQEVPSAEEFESAFQKHVLDVWFPRSLDVEYGGFLCDFDRSWNLIGSNEKLLEFQARQTWLAAEASQRFPQEDRLRNAAKHGFRYLKEMMWDRQFGGWYHRLDRSGKPLEAHTKHSHGIAYAISACLSVYEATGDLATLEHAREGFEWLEKYAYDKQNGGYFGFMLQNGDIIRDEKDCPWPAALDTKETPIGCKDSDVQADLLETFIDFYRVSPDSKIKNKLSEQMNILCQRMMLTSGALHYLCRPDWSPLPHLVRFGIQLQTSFRLLRACSILGNLPEIISTAKGLVDHTLRYGWDEDFGGFFYAGPGADPVRVAGKSLIVYTKSWWVQFEALKALLALSQHEPENWNYMKHFKTQWNYIRSFLIDHQNGGAYMTALDVLSRWRRKLGSRFIPSRITRKGSAWKDASHDGRSLLYCFWSS